MGWTYRVIRTDTEMPDGSIERDYHIEEVYDDPLGWTTGAGPWAESVDGLRVILERMLQALDKPVLVEPDGKLAEE